MSTTTTCRGHPPIAMERHQLLIAHRGWSTRFPENSVPSIAAALSAGADEVEIDLRVSRDGGIFLLHDETLDRVTDLEGPIGSFASSELEHCTVRNLDGTGLVGLGLPTFRQVHDVFGGLITFNIHVKEAPGIDIALAEIRDCLGVKNTKDHYVASDAKTLRAARTLMPGVGRCLVSDRTEAIGPLLDTATSLGCERVQFFVGNCAPADVAAAKARGLVTNYYFADSVAEAGELQHWGIDAVLTNDIGPLAVARRDQAVEPT